MKRPQDAIGRASREGAPATARSIRERRPTEPFRPLEDDLLEYFSWIGGEHSVACGAGSPLAALWKETTGAATTLFTVARKAFVEADAPTDFEVEAAREEIRESIKETRSRLRVASSAQKDGLKREWAKSRDRLDELKGRLQQAQDELAEQLRQALRAAEPVLTEFERGVSFAPAATKRRKQRADADHERRRLALRWMWSDVCITARDQEHPGDPRAPAAIMVEASPAPPPSLGLKRGAIAAACGMRCAYDAMAVVSDYFLKVELSAEKLANDNGLSRDLQALHVEHPQIWVAVVRRVARALGTADVEMARGLIDRARWFTTLITAAAKAKGEESRRDVGDKNRLAVKNAYEEVVSTLESGFTRAQLSNAIQESTSLRAANVFLGIPAIQGHLRALKCLPTTKDKPGPKRSRGA